MTTLLALFIAILFIFAYKFYAGYLERKWGIDPARKTPAHTENDGSDYVPTQAPIVFGHHFASIAGAAPIIGPIAALVFGWLPVLIWIVFAGIFFGAVHDFGSLFASIRHKGNTLGFVIGENAGHQAKKLFSGFVWLTSILVIAAFTSIVADTFIQMPAAATASILFVFVAIKFGYMYNNLKFPFLLSTIFALILMAVSIGIGLHFPLVLTKNVWMIIIILYMAVSSITPVWVLLQPRDFLNSFLLYALVILAALSIFFTNPTLQAPAFTGFTANKMPLFPLLFVIVACGAISGYHAMFASTTTSKQIENEKDIKPVAFGGMLVESFLAVIALVVAASLSQRDFSALYTNGGPIAIFSKGVGGLLNQLNLPVSAAESFVVLAISSFALTSLDSVARVARSIVQDFARTEMRQRSPKSQFMQKNIPATFVTVLVGGLAAFTNWQTIWPVFGCANQLIASLVLAILYIWFKKNGKSATVFLIPLFFMLLVTFSALLKIIQNSLASQNFVLSLVGVMLLIIAVLFVIELRNALKSR